MPTSDREYLARTAAFLAVRNPGRGMSASSDAVTLHRLAGTLHRIAERQCNEDLACSRCAGNGYQLAGGIGPAKRVCPYCAGTGSTLGKRERSAEARIRAIAAAYNCRAYFQGDPRGCPVTLVPEETVPSKNADLIDYVYDSEKSSPILPTLDMLQERWIDSHYTRGHAVPNLGR